MKLNNRYEQVIFWCITGTYLFYFTGSQYIIAAAIAWTLATITLIKWYKNQLKIPAGVWMWVGCITTFLIFSVITNITNGAAIHLIIGRLIKLFFSTGLLMAFPLVGCLPIRPQVIYRAACLLIIQSIILFPFFYIASVIKLPGYTSPFVIFDSLLKINPTNYQVSFVSLEPGRYKLFTPWAPALGFVATQLFFICKAESNKLLKYAGLLGSTLLIVASGSRAGLVTLPAVLLITFLARQGLSLITLYWGGLITGIVVMITPVLIELINDFRYGFTAARSSSSIVRERLVDIAITRGLQENFLLGNGVVESGGRIVANMPIGTHHTWAGLLFVNGLLGLLTVLVPYVVSTIYFGLLSNQSKLYELCFAILLVFGLYSVGETWESLAFLSLPALVLLGIGFRKEE
jgi:hypothetical protein